MKLTKFLAFAAMAATTLSFSACSDDDNDDPKPETPDEVKVEKVVLSATSQEIEVGKTFTLTATLEPSNAKGDIVWSSSDENVATVEAGTVTAVALGEAVVTAAVGEVSASCVITVKKIDQGGNAVKLEGTNFYVFQLDETTFNSVSNDVVMDLRIDETANKFLYIWDETYNAGSTSGKNYFGLAEGWVSLEVASAGWSGMGLCYGTKDAPFDLSKLNDIYAHPEEYYFHMGIKSTDDAVHCLIMYGADGSEAKFGIGGDFVDNGTTYPSIGSFDRDGEWQTIEFPMTKAIEAGIIYPENWVPSEGQNLVAFLSGGKTGTQLQYDAMYIYKKNK
mgnify:CR=1 FL=1